MNDEWCTINNKSHALEVPKYRSTATLSISQEIEIVMECREYNIVMANGAKVIDYSRAADAELYASSCKASVCHEPASDSQGRHASLRGGKG